MPSYYEQLVERLGEDGAKQHMRYIRSKVGKPGPKGTDEDKHAIARQKAIEDSADYEGQDNAQVEGSDSQDSETEDNRS